MSLAKLFADHNALGLNGKNSSVGHGIARVQAQIHQNLFDLRGVCPKDIGLRRESDRKFDLLFDDTLQQARCFLYQIIETEVSRLQNLAAREGEQLRCQSGCALGLLADSSELLP